MGSEARHDMMRAGALLLLLAGCSAPVATRPCPRVTEFPKPVQTAALAEIEGRPNITRMMDAMAGDREFNRSICR